MAGKPGRSGRPSLFTPQVAEEICARLSTGEPLAVICRDDHMPGYQTVSDWKKAHPDFSVQITRAREAGFDAIARESLRIIDEEPARIVVMSGDERTETRIDSASVQRAKNRAEHRLRLLAKWDPKRYGDRAAVEHSGQIGLEAWVLESLPKKDDGE